jgi:transposase-like protein
MTGHVVCPECSLHIKWSRVNYRRPFKCSRCKSVVEVPRSYLVKLTWLNVLLSLIAGYLMGSTVATMAIVACIA